MRRLLKQLLALSAAAMLAVSPAAAFSLMGPPASWQTAAIGYNIGGDVGGPMNFFEEYRPTVPVFTYGFDPTFLNFFGSNGVAAVTAAMAILNAVPPASAMSADLSEFPLRAVGPDNATAASLNIFDLKSATLSTMVGQMGLASPERWVFSLRDRIVIGTTTNYLVIQRNFDPVSWRSTNVVNGVLYTYRAIEGLQPGNYADALETRVSGNLNNITVASADDGSGQGGPKAGRFFTSLTRDDYGAFRYLLRFNNVNTETLSASVSLRANTSPYAPFTGTNATNLVGTNTAVATARRPGIEKVSFSPIPLDSLLGLAIQAVTNQYVDNYYQTNTPFALTNQPLQRVVTLPDILFLAGDLTSAAGGGSNTLGGASLVRPTSASWVNNSALPGNTVGGGSGIVSGPGVIPAGTSNSTAIVITFNTLGPSRLNRDGPGQRFVDERTAGTNGVWGYFDATTIYSVFPDGATIRDLERQLLGR